MALFHFHVTQVKRSAGQSAVASAAYRSGERLYSEYYGEVSDYTHKGGVVYSDIFLPPQAPVEYQDRAALWNAVEKAERGKKAQLAYSFDIALQNEFSIEENIALARQEDLLDYTIEAVTIQDSNNVAVNFTDHTEEVNGLLIVAAYGSDEKMEDITVQNITNSESGSMVVTLCTDEAQYVTAFIIDKLTLDPICPKIRQKVK